MVDREEIFVRLSEIDNNLKKLTEVKKTEDIKAEDSFLLARYRIQMIAEAMLAVTNQVIANKSFRKPSNYKDAFSVLLENGILMMGNIESLKQLVDIRNRLVHTYWIISKEELLEIIGKYADTVRDFVKSIAGKI